MAPTDAEVVVVGAGPYGLSTATHLRRAGIEAAVFGDPMSFWRAMPRGMQLRSNWGATSFVEHRGPLSLDAFMAETGSKVSIPVPVKSFVEYGEWVQESAVPDLDRRLVSGVSSERGGFTVRLEDGQELTARRVVVALGIAAFASRPKQFAALPDTLVSHTSEQPDLSIFAGRRLLVVGGGQSALESAMLAAEAGAEVEVIVRRPSVVWLRFPPLIKRLGRLGPILYAPTDVGPLWYSRLVSQPDLFRLLPRAAQDPIAVRSIRPAGSHWIRARLGEDRISLGREVVSARAESDRAIVELDDGSQRAVDHVLLGTGFAVDVARYGILADEIVKRLVRSRGYPELSGGLESSLPGLHFTGAPAAWSYGPIMRFVSGSWFSSRRLAASIARDRPASPRPAQRAGGQTPARR